MHLGSKGHQCFHRWAKSCAKQGLLKKRSVTSTRILPSSGGKATLTHVYTATSESAISYCQMVLSTSKRAPDLCQT
jgi:hypothetical protein